MLIIRCPHCGPRNSSEFHYAGEIHTQPDPRIADPAQWRDYLYMHHNPAGPTTERWFHRAGCRRFLSVLRDTTSNRIHAVSASPDPAPKEVEPMATGGRR